jgi:hypothetical protein
MNRLRFSRLGASKMPSSETVSTAHRNCTERGGCAYRNCTDNLRSAYRNCTDTAPHFVQKLYSFLIYQGVCSSNLESSRFRLRIRGDYGLTIFGLTFVAARVGYGGRGWQSLGVRAFGQRVLVGGRITIKYNQWCSIRVL